MEQKSNSIRGGKDSFWQNPLKMYETPKKGKHPHFPSFLCLIAKRRRWKFFCPSYRTFLILPFLLLPPNNKTETENQPFVRPPQTEETRHKDFFPSSVDRVQTIFPNTERKKRKRKIVRGGNGCVGFLGTSLGDWLSFFLCLYCLAAHFPFPENREENHNHKKKMKTLTFLSAFSILPPHPSFSRKKQKAIFSSWPAGSLLQRRSIFMDATPQFPPLKSIKIYFSLPR